MSNIFTALAVLCCTVAIFLVLILVIAMFLNVNDDILFKILIVDLCFVLATITFNVWADDI